MASMIRSRRRRPRGWKKSLLQAAAALDGLLDDTREEFQRIDLCKLVASSDDRMIALVALDTTEDAMLAILKFVRDGIGRSDGEKYLRLYGFLQATFIQQDALTELHRLFVGGKLNHSEDSGWHHLRELRNLTVGHPLAYTRKKTVKRASITRVSLHAEGFAYQTWNRETERFSDEVADLDLLILLYLSEAAEVVKAVWAVVTKAADYHPNSD